MHSYIRPYKMIDVINGSVDNVTPVTIQVANRSIIITNPGTTTLYFYPGGTVSTVTGFQLSAGGKLEVALTCDSLSILSSAASGSYSIIVVE